MENNQEKSVIQMSGKCVYSAHYDEDSDEALYVEEALLAAAYDAEEYKKVHDIEDKAGIVGAMATLAMARLDWLLEEGRNTLLDAVTESEFTTLCTVFEGRIATPHDTHDMASSVADEFGIEYESYKASPFAPLLDKLVAMSALEKVALRDLIQRFWYRSAEDDGLSITEFMEKYGLKEATEAA